MERILINKDGNYRDHHKKVPLSTVIPLSTPYLVYVDPSSYCNIKCNFCFQSIDDSLLKQVGFKPGIMKFELFRKIVHSFMEFPERIKSFKFCGLGEPLLNHCLPDMIAYTKKHGIADRIVLVTNGILLSPELNIKLIDAGLDDLLVSVEGVSSQKYDEIAGVNLDYGKFLAGIKHFYEHRNNSKVYVKLAHTGLDESGESGFHDIFDEISDNAYVEYLTEIYQGVDYSQIIDDTSINQIGERVSKKVEVCFLPFCNLTINVFGKVSPCIFDYKENLVVGDVNTGSLVDIWNCSKLNEFRVLQLNKERSKHSDCSKCTWLSICGDSIYKNIIDYDAHDLIKYFQPRQTLSD